MTDEDKAQRHAAVTHVMNQFTYDHLPDDLRDISRDCCELAARMFDQIQDTPELTVGLRKLLEAKDCFVRAVVATRENT